MKVLASRANPFRRFTFDSMADGVVEMLPTDRSIVTVKTVAKKEGAPPGAFHYWRLLCVLLLASTCAQILKPSRPFVPVLLTEAGEGAGQVDH